MTNTLYYGDNLEILRRYAGVGFYSDPHGARYPRLQTPTVEELMRGATVAYPRYAVNQTFKQAARAPGATDAANEELF